MSAPPGESEGGAKGRANRPKLSLGISQNEGTNIARTPSPSTLLGGFSVSGLYNSAIPDFSPDPASRKNSRNPFADSFSEHIRRSSETEHNTSLQVPKDTASSVHGNSPPHTQENGRRTPDVRPPQIDEVTAAQPPYVVSRGVSPSATPTTLSPTRRDLQAEPDMRQNAPVEHQQDDYATLGAYSYGASGQPPPQPQPPKNDPMPYGTTQYHPYAPPNSAPQPQNPPSKLPPPPASPAMRQPPQPQPQPGYYRPPYPPGAYVQPYPPPSPAGLNGYPPPLPYPPGISGPVMGSDPYGRPGAPGMYMGGGPPPMPVGFPGQAVPNAYGIEQPRPTARKGSVRAETGKGDKRRRVSSPGLSSAEDDTDGTAGERVGGGDFSLEEARRRNRAAAMRCRQKKKMQMAELEKRAGKLSEENKELSNSVHALRSEVLHLKELIIEHKKHCSLDFASSASITALGQQKASP